MKSTNPTSTKNPDRLPPLRGAAGKGPLEELLRGLARPFAAGDGAAGRSGLAGQSDGNAFGENRCAGRQTGSRAANAPKAERSDFRRAHPGPADSFGEKPGFADRWIERIVRTAAVGMGRMLYRVRVDGAGNLPPQGGCLVVCNHVSYADTVPLSIAVRRRLRFTSDARLFGIPLLGRCLRAFGSIPVSAEGARASIRRIAERVRGGEAALLFPEGRLTLDGHPQPAKDGYALIARKAGCPIVMVHLGGLWGSIFSFEGGRFFFKRPRAWRREVRVTISRPLPAAEATPRVLESFWLDCERKGGLA